MSPRRRSHDVKASERRWLRSSSFGVRRPVKRGADPSTRYHRRRRCWALWAPSLGEASSAWEKMCHATHFVVGTCRPPPRNPPKPRRLGPWCLRMVQAMANGGVVQQCPPRRNSTLAAEAAVVCWAGHEANEIALDRRRWSVTRGKFMERCSMTFSEPALLRRAAI